MLMFLSLFSTDVLGMEAKIVGLYKNFAGKSGGI